jgi:CP family cyanate transporter-like MFS transporter
MPERRSSILLVLATLTAFTLHLVMFAYSVLMGPVAQDLGITWAEAGLIFSISIAAIVAARIPLGFIIDRLGFMVVIRASLIVIAIFGITRGFAPNYPVLLACQLMVGVGFAPVLPSLAKIVSDVFPKRAGLTTGLYAAGFPLGEMAGLGVSSWVLSISGENWRLAFVVLGIWSLLLAAAWWLAVPNQPVPGVKVSLPRIRLSAILRNPQLWLLTGLCACSMGAYDTLLVWAPQLLQLKGVSTSDAALTATVIPAGFLIAGPLLGFLSDRSGRRKPFLLFMALGGSLCTLAVAWLGGLPGWVMLFISGFALSGLMTLVFVIPAEDPALAGQTGTVMGLITSLGNAGSFFLPIALGAIVDATNSPAWALGLLAAAVAVAFFLALGIRESAHLQRNRPGATLDH